MTDRENFIARWSRRKRASTDDADAMKTPAAPAAADGCATEQDSEHATAHDKRVRSDAAAAQSDAPELACDLTKLPPIESIGAGTDISAFLAPGVPPELTRAALRRAWSADPMIRDYIGLSENAWDFNAAGSMAGFGPLEMTDELRRQIARMVGRSLIAEPDGPAPAATEMQGAQASVESPGESGATTPESPTEQAQGNRGTFEDESLNSDVERHNLLQCGQDHTAAQYSTAKSDDVKLIVKRPHGRALPK